MLNKLREFIRKENMIFPGDRVICAVSGGADSMALLWGLYLLRESLDFDLEAAHFHHGLRGSESDRDAAFVAEFCQRFDIPLHLGQGRVEKGEKGLEAAAREARYAFLRSLPGKIATAHTANDNAETVLLNMIRGSGLKGLGGITSVGDRLIRPMLTVTRREILDFLQEYHISFVLDSTNAEDGFRRNRLRHHVMPLLEAENPRLAENMSAMALRLRQDAACLEEWTQAEKTLDVPRLRVLSGPVRSRILEQFLKENGVKEPTGRHIALAEALVFSDKPSAKAQFPGGVVLTRRYDTLELLESAEPLPRQAVACPGMTEIPGWRILCRPAETAQNGPQIFTVAVEGNVRVRCREAGDALHTAGGTKPLKKLFVDAKIPAAKRPQIPVLEDEGGILGVCGFGADELRKADGPQAMQFVFEKTE